MTHEAFTVELLKYDYQDYGIQSRKYHYTYSIERAEWYANEWSKKNIRSTRWCYEGKIICESVRIPNRNRTFNPRTKQLDGAAYVPLVVGTSYNGTMAYTDEWIEHTSVSAVVDGVKYSVTLDNEEA